MIKCAAGFVSQYGDLQAIVCSRLGLKSYLARRPLENLVLVGFRRLLVNDYSPLCRVPLITVFTKYDMLVEQVQFGNNLEFHKRNKHLDPETRNARLAEETTAKFQELCVRPFKEVVGSDIPHIAVSSKLQRDF
jgi:hypothetical protein